MKLYRTLFIVAALVIVMVPVCSWAQIDSGPDGIGIYFDENATVVSTTAVVGDVVEAYLIATNLTHSGEIGMWEAKMCPWGGLGEIDGTPTHGGYNYNMNMPGDLCWACTTFAFDTPFPTSNIAILAHLNIIIWDDSAPINLHLNADWCRYWTIDGGDDGFALYPSSGSSDLPVATINGPAPVAVVNTEWGAIKAMYR